MFTVNTHIVRPHSVLQPFVRCFAIRRFDTNGQELPKPMIADHEMTMAFFLHSKLFDFRAFDNKTPVFSAKENRVADYYFTGLQTTTKGFVVFKGATTILNIHFKPTGFFHIFNICPQELVDKIDELAIILSNEVYFLQDQLHECGSIEDCIQVLELFLIKKLLSQKPKYKHAGILQASDLLIKQRGQCSIKQLANHCNMTLQTFEVQFTEQIGIPPKTFSRLLRFGSAVDIKLYQPLKSWTQIANLCGYYDQTHFIKEFKEFTFLSPGKFIKTMNPVLENFDMDI